MEFQAISQTDLETWEEWLNHLNSECIVPQQHLNSALSSEILPSILQKNENIHQNLAYQNANAHISKRYINEAWIWAQTLRPLLPAQHITELCPGASIVIDMALSYLNYDRNFEKVDYYIWKELQNQIVKRPYTSYFKELNIITHTQAIPKTDLLILNHTIDDLFMGLWNDSHQAKFWEHFRDMDKVDASWELAMPERDLYLPQLRQLFKTVPSRLNPHGWLILREYPSAYEVHRKHISRINFTKELVATLVQELLDQGMHLHRPKLEPTYHPAVSETFYCLSFNET